MSRLSFRRATKRGSVERCFSSVPLQDCPVVEVPDVNGMGKGATRLMVRRRKYDVLAVSGTS